MLFLILLIIVLYFVNKSNFTEYSPEDSEYVKPLVYENVVTPGEAEYILEKANDQFEDSKVLSGVSIDIRKSKTAWLYPSDPVIKSIIQRVCDLGNYPIENAEALQVVKYEPGGYYNEHHDSCCDPYDECVEFVKNGGQRVLTMLIYLNDSFTGGETSFPKLNLKLKAPKYGGILFYPLEKHGNRCHPHAIHKGMPIESGVKYVCNVWIRESKLR